MAGESLSCTASRKKSKNKSSNYSLSSENGGAGDGAGQPNGNGKARVPPVITTRGGLRVYKVVILGDGGVGKSGECKCVFLFLINYVLLFWEKCNL